MEVLTAAELDSYDDRNYLVTSPSSSFVLKIHNGADASQFPLAQAEALESLARQGVACPVDHQRGVCLQDHFVRLLVYVPGELLFHHAHKTLGMYVALGEFLARVDLGLKASHVADRHEVVQSRELQWDLRYFAQLEFFVNSLPAQDQRQACAKTLREFAELDSQTFQFGLVHNDANDRNVLVVGRGFAIIDFGDMVYTWLVSEVAIAMAYVVVGWFTDQQSDDVWLDRVGALFQGYRAIVPLSPAEVDALYLLVKCRITTSACLGAHSCLLNPENAAYLLVHAKPAWDSLAALDRVGKAGFDKGLVSAAH